MTERKIKDEGAKEASYLVDISAEREAGILKQIATVLKVSEESIGKNDAAQTLGSYFKQLMMNLRASAPIKGHIARMQEKQNFAVCAFALAAAAYFEDKKKLKQKWAGAAKEEKSKIAAK
jgi:glycine cleavage system regulatory protein